MSEFMFYNPNPKGIKATDCVIRALCKFTGFGWYQVHVELCEFSRNLGRTQTDMKVVEYFLERHGLAKKMNIRNKDNTRLKVKDLIGDKTVLCRLAGHLVCYSNGYHYDLYDCGGKSIYKAWVRK